MDGHVAGSPDEFNQTFSANSPELDSSEDEVIGLWLFLWSYS